MDWAWGAADVAVCRAGAGSVAEAWANGVPTVFLPYPYHKDEHQRLNAAPMVATGGAAVMADRVDAAADAAVLEERLGALLADAGERGRWREALERTRPADGAGVVARWVAGV
jgi:UDP-N-acetylglucosamine--N-acetylmuramyl-(pentapeptide) pyrophosphoryl-undecaprenol N-acetylglucosamine transferase